MQKVLSAVGEALAMAGSMGWEILWALILGFFLSGVVEAVVRKETVSRWIGDDRPKSLAVATGLGAASSRAPTPRWRWPGRCSARGRTSPRRWRSRSPRTNLVIELGIILALLMGWQFTLAEFVGGPLMIIILAVLFRLFLRRRIVDAAREQADKGLAGRMEGHAAMDMGVHEGGTPCAGSLLPPGFTADRHYFVMNWASVCATSSSACSSPARSPPGCPTFWLQSFFLADNPTAAAIWGPLIGPLVAVI